MIICTKKITAMKDGRFLVGSEIVRSGAIISMESPGDTFIIEVCNGKTETEADKERRQTGESGIAINEKLASSFMCYPGGTADWIEQMKGMEKKIEVERIAQLEKENVKAQSLRDEAIEKYSTLTLKYSKLADDYVSITNSSIAYRKKIDSLEEEVIKLQNKNTNLQEEIVWQFEQLTDKVGTLQDQNAKLREKLDAAAKEKNSAGSRLVEHLRQMEQRVKDLECEADERSRPPRPTFFL